MSLRLFSVLCYISLRRDISGRVPSATACSLVPSPWACPSASPMPWPPSFQPLPSPILLLPNQSSSSQAWSYLSSVQKPNGSSLSAKERLTTLGWHPDSSTSSTSWAAVSAQTPPASLWAGLFNQLYPLNTAQAFLPLHLASMHSPTYSREMFWVMTTSQADLLKATGTQTQESLWNSGKGWL